jgi:Fic family protein
MPAKMTKIKHLDSLSPQRFETPAILKRLASASRKLAELKGVATAIPRQDILINTLGLQEAKDSSAIENIVTTHDEIFKDAAFPEVSASPAAKDVLRYRQALGVGFTAVQESGLLTLNHIGEIHNALENNKAGYRKLPGTTLKDGKGHTIYTPPQDPADILILMRELERFINDDFPFDADPLIKMALLHHQFESIHPFYDGNGRTGRILNVLYLVKQGLLDTPILYLSRHIVLTKSTYYQLLQDVRERDVWEEWVLYMLTIVERTASNALVTVTSIREALMEAKHHIRAKHKFYSQDLINNLFTHPYTKIEFLMRDLDVSRLTATKYLDALAKEGFLKKKKIGRTNFYINRTLNDILTGESMQGDR